MQQHSPKKMMESLCSLRRCNHNHRRSTQFGMKHEVYIFFTDVTDWFLSPRRPLWRRWLRMSALKSPRHENEHWTNANILHTPCMCYTVKTFFSFLKSFFDRFSQILRLYPRRIPIKINQFVSAKNRVLNWQEHRVNKIDRLLCYCCCMTMVSLFWSMRRKISKPFLLPYHAVWLISWKTLCYWELGDKSIRKSFPLIPENELERESFRSSFQLISSPPP